MRTKQLIALFFAGFFAKDMIDDIFFLVRNEYPIEIFGLKVSASAHQIMLVVSVVLTTFFLWYGLKRRNGKTELHD